VKEEETGDTEMQQNWAGVGRGGSARLQTIEGLGKCTRRNPILHIRLQRN